VGKFAASKRAIGIVLAMVTVPLPVFAMKIQQQPPVNFQKQSSALFLLDLIQ
jgi:hypothetical protein